uniref:Late endosomal/lysosomal adaptor and MAPK and MTOR activator 4 n=1 Tax=Ixodes ricinus TaxID=34613 RepID=V5HPD3_IXORI
MHGWMEKIPDQVGLLILNSDGGVISSGGELENEERIGGIIHKMVYCADKSDLMPTDNRDPRQPKCLSTSATNFYAVTLSNQKNLTSPRRMYIPAEPNKIV